MRGTFRDETLAELVAAERNLLRGISPRMNGVVRSFPASRFIVLAVLLVLCKRREGDVPEKFIKVIPLNGNNFFGCFDSGLLG
jgi:hypothetical protein